MSRSYSEAALSAAVQTRERFGELVEGGLAAAHDREALGLDASARIGDILVEVVEMLRANVPDLLVDVFAGPEDSGAWRNQTYREWAREGADTATSQMIDALEREFGASHDC